MTMYKRIYWRPDTNEHAEGKVKEGMMYANVHLLIGYNSGSISDYREMAEELRKTFPQAKDEDLKCHRVRGSSYVDGFTLLVWDAWISKETYRGWEDWEQKPEYNW